MWEFSFQCKKLKNNIGGYTYFAFIACQIANIIYYLLTSIEPLKQQILKIVSNPPNNISSAPNAENQDHVDRKESGKVFIHTSSHEIEIPVTTEPADNVILTETKGLNEPTLKKTDTSGSPIIDNNAIPTSQSLEPKDFSEMEMHDLSYEEALEFDKRKFKSIYWHNLKFQHSVLNAFVLNNEKELKAIKISMFFFSISLDLAFNALFFNESIQNENYESSGNLNFLVTLPTVIYSSLVSVFLAKLLTFITSFDLF